MTLTTKNFSTGYQNKDVIKSINLTLENVEWLGIIGANGSGKSTFLKGISRILKPSSGAAFLNGQNIHLSSTQSIAKEMSVLPQLQTIDLQMSVYELVCLGWIASINPLTFAIEPIRMAYHSSIDLRAILIDAPYGEVNGYSCLAILLILTVGLFFLIRPLLNRKLA